MFIRWHGYSCFEFADDRVRMVMDPHDGKSIGIWPPTVAANLVLCTHNNYDRNAFRVIYGHHKDYTEAIGEIDFNGFKITGLPSFSDDKMGAERGVNAIYMFEMDGLRIAFCGGLGDIPSDKVVDRMRGTDIMFVPIGEYGTMPLEKVDVFVSKVEPKVVVPTDYRVGGITLPLSTLSQYMEGKDEEDFVHVGNEVELMEDDISEFTGYWIFDR